ncbi:hypothetical protein [Roseomonas sp. BN140053]|uniref:hypothetical protein n=1 Tax=Roseomonas sp. BN140053 TaxID=3391898 RepID=UPI0039ED94DD
MCPDRTAQRRALLLNRARFLRWMAGRCTRLATAQQTVALVALYATDAASYRSASDALVRQAVAL